MKGLYGNRRENPCSHRLSMILTAGPSFFVNVMRWKFEMQMPTFTKKCRLDDPSYHDGFSHDSISSTGSMRKQIGTKNKWYFWRRLRATREKSRIYWRRLEGKKEGSKEWGEADGMFFHGAEYGPKIRIQSPISGHFGKTSQSKTFTWKNLLKF